MGPRPVGLQREAVISLIGSAVLEEDLLTGPGDGHRAIVEPQG
jgi:hypothetical protein